MKPLLSLLLLVAACSKDNPYYCEQNPDHNCNIDGGTSGSSDSTMACTTADDCSGGTPACNDATGICVACTATDIGACTGTKPVCSTSNSCRACTMNTECASGACMPDGSCADSAAVLYASPTGGATTCAMGDKCSLEAAITAADTSKKLIVLDAGTYNTTGSVSIGKEVTLLARAATIVKGGAGDGPVLNVTSGGNLTVLYAEIKNGDGDSLGHGIQCAGGTVLARFVSIHNNGANGINSTGCTVTIDRSTIFSNPGGGISLTGTTSAFTITNNRIYLNGNNSLSLFGGVKLAISAPPSTSMLEFNTIIDNQAIGNTGNSGGVVCAAAFAAPNNIVARNQYSGSTSATDANTYGSCTFATSKIQADVTDLAFVSAGPTYDLKIGQNSTAKDGATTASTVSVDFDGDERPQNGQKDIGADEYK